MVVVTMRKVAASDIGRSCDRVFAINTFFGLFERSSLFVFIASYGLRILNP